MITARSSILRRRVVAAGLVTLTAAAAVLLPVALGSVLLAAEGEVRLAAPPWLFAAGGATPGNSAASGDPSGGPKAASLPAVDFSRPLGLVDCYRLALQTSERIAIADENYQQAILQKDRALALVMPKVTGKGTYFRQENDLPSFGTGDPNSGGGSSNLGKSFSPPAQRQVWLFFEQPIFAGMREYIARKQASYAIDSRGFSLEQAKLVLFGSVARAFYNVLAAERRQETLKSTAALERERLREIRARQEVGLARKTEVLLIETQLANDEAALIRAQNDVDSARTTLSFFTGRPPEAPLEDSFPASEPPPPLETLIRQAEESRQDLASAESNVKVAEQGVKLITHEALPLIKAQADWWGHREGFLSTVNWDFTVMADLPIFTGGDRKARAADARSKLRQAELTRDEIKRTIGVEVTQAYLDLQSEDGLITSLEAAVRSAEENYNLSQEEYRQGLATNLDVQTALDLLQRSTLAREQENFNRKATWIRLHATVGAIPGVTLD